MDSNFKMSFSVPELQDVPLPRSQPKTESSIPTSLRLSNNLEKLMTLHVDQVGLDRRRFEYSVKSQQNALELLSHLKLYIPHHEEEERDIQAKYSIQKTTSNKFNGKSPNSKGRYRRSTRIYQCQCGVDHTAGRHASKNRQIPWENVDCLSWIRLVAVHDEENGKSVIAIDEISGIFDHSDPCIEQIEMDRNPRIPLHPELRNFALELLRKNTPLSLLRSECAAWAEAKWPGSVGDNHSRYRLTTHDTSSLYRSISRERGIYQRTAAEENLDKWFRADKPQPPSRLLTDSCFHYQAHEKPKTDRFEIILSTPEMQAAAWKFGHKKQVLMDLTFGVCSARALLAILMALDENGTGIPICYIMFTARETAKATHADYDTALLDRLLGIFKQKLGCNERGEEFDILIGSTDNDPRERTSLSRNWPEILLLLCMFHIWQAWRNMLNRRLQPIPKGEQRQLVRKQLGKLLMELLKDITDHAAAIKRFTEEVKRWEKIGRKRDASSKCQALAALDFLSYIQGYVENEAYWLSWSPAGAIEAARQLKVPVSRIARTTNPLESFNGRIKGKYYKPYQHSGRLPRIDVWILLLVTAVMPDFFKEQENKKQLNEFYASKRVLVLPESHQSTASPFSAQNSEFSGSSESPTEDATDASDIPNSNDIVMLQQWLKDLENEDPDESPTVLGSSVEILDDVLNQPLNANPIDSDMSSFEIINYNELQDTEESNHNHDQPCHYNIASETSDDWFPDSNLPSGSGNLIPVSPSSSYTSERALEESAILLDLEGISTSSKTCSNHDRHRLLLVVPPSPDKSTANQEHINEIATAMMELQVNEDQILKNLQTVFRLSPQSAPQLEKYISPNLRDRLNSSSQQSASMSPSLRTDQNSLGANPDANISPGLVPFIRNIKEARKPSYGIR